MLAVCGRHHRFEAHRAVAAHHGGRGRGRVCGDHQSLGWRERVAAVGERCRRRRRRRGLRVAGQWGCARRCDHRTVAMSRVLGLSVSVCAMGRGGEGLARVAIVARVGVGVIVGFGVVPVAAVVGVGGRQRVVL